MIFAMFFCHYGAFLPGNGGKTYIRVNQNPVFALFSVCSFACMQFCSIERNKILLLLVCVAIKCDLCIKSEKAFYD